MKKEDKLLFNKLRNNQLFINVYDKLVNGLKMNYNEASYILSISLIFLKEYKDTNISTYLEFSYYLILKYSITNNDYAPLYRFAIDNGLYPIIKSLYKHDKINKNIDDEIVNDLTDNFRTEIGIETYQQNKQMNSLLQSKNNFNSFIAPTSYGKSALIYREIFSNLDKYKRIAIIVPKKTLIWQVYRELNRNKKSTTHKIIFHDRMFTNQERFIAVLTQERALRLISQKLIYFDKMFVDEAHNLFEKDDRNILLARLIRLNKQLNPNQEIVYLSPLISNSSNLRIKNQEISEFKISFSIKELNIFLLEEELNVFSYDKYLGRYLPIKKHLDYLAYLNETKLDKNLVYLRSPRNVEKISIIISNSLPINANSNIEQIIEVLKKYVDPDFYMIDTLRKGIIYLHGKLPDLIKEFIEYKYESLPEIKFLCANSVILEGVNFPIDNLYIFDTYSMNKKTMLNLIGRVNRLSYVFGEQFNLQKLLIPVHFVETVEFNKKRIMRNYIDKFRNEIEDDDIQNPILDLSENKDDLNTIQNEEIYLNSFNNGDNTITKILVGNGINLLYSNYQLAEAKIYHRILYFKTAKDYFNHEDIDIIDLIWEIFFQDFDFFDFKDKEAARLLEEQARKFYKLYINKAYHYDLKTKISVFMKYFTKIINTSEDTLFYVGDSYGEAIKKTFGYKENNRKVYIDLKKKNKKELVNIAIIKAKIEDDFVSFYIDKFVRSLFEFEVIEESEYELFRYGTVEKSLIELYTFGLSPKIINLLISENLVNEIYIDINGEIKYSEILKKYINKQDELVIFEFNRISEIK